MHAWRAGEKSLLFFFRTHTANRLRQILDKCISRELDARRELVLGGVEAFRQLRSRFTRRNGSLIVISDLRVRLHVWEERPDHGTGDGPASVE
jgi:hypothetical protein